VRGKNHRPRTDHPKEQALTQELGRARAKLDLSTLFLGDHAVVLLFVDDVRPHADGEIA
jgi:hypothetical protein